jgi:CSLREA domain-containing protein
MPEILEARTVPAIISVTTLGDDLTPNDGTVSLREAIAAMNAGNDLGDPDIIAQSLGGFGTNDTINFAVSGMISLGSALPTIDDSLALVGPGATDLSISGGGAVRVFDVAAGVNVSMSGLTVTGGFDPVQGAGIQNAGTLALTLCVVSGNAANNGIVSGSGGGVYNAATGTLTLTDTTISGNSASEFTTGARGGGGVLNDGVLTASGSTFAGNAVTLADGNDLSKHLRGEQREFRRWDSKQWHLNNRQ